MNKKIYRLKFRNEKGFTLLEFMTAFVIVSILATIIMANFIYSKRRATETSIITNMRTLQIMLETYRVDWEAYPEQLTTLGLEATEKKYNKSVSNPATKQKGFVDPSNIWSIDFQMPSGTNAETLRGRVAYQYIDRTKYYLFGYDEKGFFIERKKKPYTVTNGEVVK